MYGNMKSLYDISLKINEAEYRKLPALNYSLLSKFQSVGFNIEKLQEKINTPSLLFGRVTDALITGGQEEFDNLFLVSDLPTIPDSASNCIKILWTKYNDTYRRLKDYPEEVLNTELQCNGFWPSTKYSASARIKGFFKYPVEEYYQLYYIAENKTIINTATKQNVDRAVEALKTSSATSIYFRDSSPWDDTERLYQLKFKATLNGIDYKCMMDECVVVHEHKLIIPIDLKTSCSCEEENFYHNFLQWHY